jgi:glycerol-3-phosphate dehydrogenase (NAD(P)+)
MKVAVIGDGGWGSALALVLARNGHSVAVWGPDAAYLEEVSRTRENPRFLAGVRMEGDLRWSSVPEEVAGGAEAVVFVVPSQYARATMRKFAGAVAASGARAVSATKGFEEESLRRMTELMRDEWGVAAPAALSGPSIAPETARGVPTAVTVACAEAGVAEFFQRLFAGESFRVYTSGDVTGVELGGALKNVIALAAGICDGLGYGYNAKAALVTRGAAEIARLGVAMGAREETFAGLSGIGDLMVTCFSPQSRNHTVGERLGRGESLEDILGGMVQVAEGVRTCASALALARKHGVDVPIVEEVDAVLHGGRSAREAVRRLMGRPGKAEREGAGGAGGAG